MKYLSSYIQKTSFKASGSKKYLSENIKESINDEKKVQFNVLIKHF